MKPSPDDLLAVVQMCGDGLLELSDRDWETPVEGLQWTCGQTVEHARDVDRSRVGGAGCARLPHMRWPGGKVTCGPGPVVGFGRCQTKRNAAQETIPPVGATSTAR